MSAAFYQRAPRAADATALFLAAIGVVLATWLVVASDSDPRQVLWPLVMAPVAIAALPIFMPISGARLTAVLALGVWCVLTGFTIGFLLLPALAALLVALVQGR